MNNQAINRSDTIMQKLGNLKNAIHHSNNNLDQYLHNQRLNSSTQNHNHNSYRKSLQKKLQRLFKQQKQMFSQGASLIQNQESQPSQPIVHKNIQGFTVDRMENKLRQLERKYLNIDDSLKQKQKQSRFYKYTKQGSKVNKNKNISTQVRLGTNQRSSKVSPNRPKTFQSNNQDKKLKSQLKSIKKQISNLTKLNCALVQKLDYKEQLKKNKKIQSKQVLKQILNRLDDIRCKMITGKCKKTFNTKQSNKQHMDLMNQLEQVTRHLKNQIVQKQLLEQKNAWIQNQLKLLNTQ